MKFSDETLMAYADGELDAETRAAIERELAADPDIARRVAQHLSLAKKIGAAFDPVLREAVPDRLKDAVAADTGTVIGLPKLRAATPARTWSWPQWSAIAASLVVGVLAGRMFLPDRSPAQMAMESGGFVARGALEQALSTQLASTQAGDAPIRIGISFRSKSGTYCRTFSLANGWAGLGCKAGSDWHLEAVARAPTDTHSSDAYRMAADEVPAAVMREVEQRIAGSSLDAREEEAALHRAWHD
jgi:hypothetical protein